MLPLTLKALRANLARREAAVRVDSRRDTTSLARVFGVKPVASALSVVVVEDEDETSVEPSNPVGFVVRHRSNSLAASTGILSSFPPSRKAPN